MSTTVTEKATWARLPAASVATQVTVVSPAGKTDPEAGVQTIEGAGSAASLALGTA